MVALKALLRLCVRYDLVSHNLTACDCNMSGEINITCANMVVVNDQKRSLY